MTATTRRRPTRASRRVRAFLCRRGARLSFLWGFTEATLFFLLPDVGVGAVALFGLRRGLRAAGAAIVGALLGGLALYGVTRWAGPGVLAVLDGVPGVPTSFLARVHEGVAGRGGWALFFGPTEGIPYKLYAAEWALAGHGPVSLALWTVAARAARIVPAALIAWSVGALWRRWFGNARPGPILLLYLGFWLAGYAAYFSVVGF